MFWLMRWRARWDIGERRRESEKVRAEKTCAAKVKNYGEPEECPTFVGQLAQVGCIASRGSLKTVRRIAHGRFSLFFCAQVQVAQQHLFAVKLIKYAAENDPDQLDGRVGFDGGRERTAQGYSRCWLSDVEQDVVAFVVSRAKLPQYGPQDVFCMGHLLDFKHDAFNLRVR